jgi:hypothetical protein
LRIKDKEILDMFGMLGKKKYYTPAEISKKFQVNEYIDILKDDNADDISKRTANEMLKKNTEKLAMLAIVQESIKGLPNGIPNFAENVLAGLQQQEMKMGGELPKAQFGVPEHLQEDYKKAKSIVTPSTTYVSPLNSTVNSTINEIQKQHEDYSKWKHEPKADDYISNKGVGRMILGIAEALPIVSVPATAYELVNNYRKGEPMEDAFWNLLPFANTVIGARQNIKDNEEKKKEFIKDYEDYYNNSKNTPVTTNSETSQQDTMTKPTADTNTSTNQSYATIGDKVFKTKEEYDAYIKSLESSKTNTSTKSSKTNETYNTVKVIDDPDVQSFKIGGELKKYQNGGDKKQESIDKYGYYKEIPESTSSDVYDLYFGNLRVRYKNNKAVAVELKDGTKYKINTKGSFSNVNDPKDVKQFTQYDELPRLTSIATERGVKFDPTQFTNVVNIQAPQRGSIYGIEMTPDQWSDFERRHSQFIEKSTGDNFKDWKTKVEKGDKGSVAKFQKAYNDYIGYEYFKKRDSHKDPYGVDDKLGWITFSAPALYSGIEPEKPVEVNTNSTVNVTDNEKVNVDTTTPKLDDPFPKDTPRPIDTWFAPDITNFVGSLTDKINRYEPAMSKLDFVNPDYVLLDPTRQLAANQEQMARFSNQLENSVDPQIALATMLGASGQGFQNAANVLGNVENANVQITNQALNNSAQIENQEIGVNEAARQNYISQMATLNENEDRARNLKKWRVINAYNQGWHNYNKDQMMEQVLFPQVHIDNITSDVSVVPGRNITVPNTYSNFMSSGSMGVSNEFFEDLWAKVPGNTSQEKLDYMKAYSMYANPKLAAFSANDYQNYMMQKFGGFINNKK